MEISPVSSLTLGPPSDRQSGPAVTAVRWLSALGGPCWRSSGIAVPWKEVSRSCPVDTSHPGAGNSAGDVVYTQATVPIEVSSLLGEIKFSKSLQLFRQVDFICER